MKARLLIQLISLVLWFIAGTMFIWAKTDPKLLIGLFIAFWANNLGNIK